MKLTLTKIFRTNKAKDGTPLVTKDGRNYERVSIQTQEYGTRWLSGFGNNDNLNWREGDTVNLKVEEKGQYLNFSRLDPVDELTTRVEALEKAVFSKPQDPISIEPADIPF